MFDCYRFVGIHIQRKYLFIRSHDSDLHLQPRILYGFLSLDLWRCCCSTRKEKDEFQCGSWRKQELRVKTVGRLAKLSFLLIPSEWSKLLNLVRWFISSWTRTQQYKEQPQVTNLLRIIFQFSVFIDNY